jgi:WD40 repeat protein
MKFHTIWTVAVLFGILCKGFAPQRFLLSKSTSYPSILKSTYDGGGSQFYDDFGDSQSQFFDDFGDSLIGSSPDSSGLFMDSLQAKMVQTREVEAANEAKLSKNWRTGNWSVRGFSLAKEKTSQYNEDEQRGVVHVSSVAAPMSASLRDMSVIGGNELPERRTVAVGRTDGSVFLVRLGEAYLTKFASTPKLVENSKGEDFSVRIEDQWVEQAQIRPDEQEKLKPFKVLHNFQSSETGERCHSIAYYDIIEDDNDGYICTASGDSDVIKLFTLPRAGEQIQCNTLTGGHQSTVVSLKTMVLQSNNREELHLLISASKDGIISFWDLSKRGQLLLSCRSIDDRNKDALLTCLDVSNPSISKFYGYEPNEQTYLDMVFVGLKNGYVLGYAIHVILSSGECSSPDIAFRAHGADSGNGQGVTAIKCGGDGTIKNDSSGSRPNISSSTLLTGGDDGSVKQWYVLLVYCILFDVTSVHA